MSFKAAGCWSGGKGGLFYLPKNPPHFVSQGRLMRVRSLKTVTHPCVLTGLHHMCYQLSHECGKAPQAAWHHGLWKPSYTLTHRGGSGKAKDMEDSVENSWKQRKQTQIKTPPHFEFQLCSCVHQFDQLEIQVWVIISTAGYKCVLDFQ